MIKDGKSATEVAADRREHERGVERQQWAQLYRTYERCVEIAETIWADRLDGAQFIQQGLAEQMRDRVVSRPSTLGALLSVAPVEIPVPLFTPRDRQQFIKEVATTLLISADRRNLTVQFPKEEPSAPAQSEGSEGAGVEAASGADETALDAEAAEISPA